MYSTCYYRQGQNAKFAERPDDLPTSKLTLRLM